MIEKNKNLKVSPIHPFPARMAPSIVWDSLPDHGSPMKILDPMAGSGTSLVIAKALGHQAIGCDTDPLAILLASAWCSDIKSDKLLQHANLILSNAKDFAKRIKLENAYPNQADHETRQFIEFWFDDNSRVQLTALANFISRITNANEKNILWIAFSRMIITKKSVYPSLWMFLTVVHIRSMRKHLLAHLKSLLILSNI